MKTISQYQPRCRIDSVLQDVEHAEAVHITVAGRPVADLVSIQKVRCTFVPRSEVEKLLAHNSMDR